jgi:hypothetical protein
VKNLTKDFTDMVCSTFGWHFSSVYGHAQVVTGLAPEMPQFNSRPVHTKFVVYKTALGQDFLAVFPY